MLPGPTARTWEELLRYCLSDLETMTTIDLLDKNQTTVIFDGGEAAARNVRSGLVKIGTPTFGEESFAKRNETKGHSQGRTNIEPSPTCFDLMLLKRLLGVALLACL